MNILFVCSRNQWRSPSAEAIYKNSQAHNARSAGTSANARIKINQALIDWAEIIFVMENKHRQILIQKFNINQPLIVLDIPDEYQYIDPELIAMLKTSVEAYLK